MSRALLLLLFWCGPCGWTSQLWCWQRVGNMFKLATVLDRFRRRVDSVEVVIVMVMVVMVIVECYGRCGGVIRCDDGGTSNLYVLKGR
jgi:hypothetical protein